MHKEHVKESFSLGEHALIYLSVGRLEINGYGNPVQLRPGECAFVRKDCHLTLTKSCAEDGTPYKAVTMIFPRNFLIKYYRHMRDSHIPKDASRSDSPVLRIPPRPDVSGLFLSLMPYFRSTEKPDRNWLDLKLSEGLHCILLTDPDVYASLFDFTGKWKIDLESFMEENFTEDLSLADFANYTGRSLAAFNRDFRKAFGRAPRKWLIERKLQLARKLLREHRKGVQETMEEAGFRNLSHFSRIYKSAFGCSPVKDRDNIR